ncbi:S-layer homology domain-containing protein [Cohnella rhizosphaerae]|uniref:S-layer homology domain-containing protein n=1 Tax=Cohnella rhizosphaerae TaxID=1457232 RepID=A0A9X4L1H1_9BACL|nr:S-layer homology domain-containing protein [Cohnella rhizosphaerae]MDG0811794.1 S-layer homology domain-containing protein [Cohnella rhizosphaerae]
MKLLNTRFIAWVLTLALVATLLPLTPVKSADAASAYFQFDDYSTSDQAPSEVNNNVIDIAGTFSGVSSTTINYKIEKLIINGSTTKVAESSIGSTKPIITGSNSFRFAGITIYDGLNRITVTGTNTAGNIVDGTAYVNFTNVPVISDIKLIDGTVLPESSSLLVTSPTATISLKAPNATEVTINGTQMFGGAGSSFVLSGIALNHGLNTLTIVAKNATKTYELKRYLVYYNGSLTAYGVKMGTQEIGGEPTFTSAIASTSVSGTVVIPYTGTTVPAGNVTVELWKTGDTAATSVSGSTYSLVNTTPGYVIYNFTTIANNFDVSTNGDYYLRIIGPSPTLTDTLAFKMLLSGSPSIAGIKQMYNVTVPSSGTTVTAASTANFSNNAVVSQLPLYLLLDTLNFGSNTVDVKVERGTEDVTAQSDIVKNSYFDGAGKPVLLIRSLPAGQLKLTFAIKNGATTLYTLTRAFTYNPAPAIQIENLYTGMTFTDPTNFLNYNIVGSLPNFNLYTAAELNSLQVTLNGRTVPLNQGSNITISSGKFTFVPGNTTPTPISLVAGANTITFSGKASGVPVSTSYTIYLFSDDEPAVTSIRPVPYVLPPNNDDPTLPKRKFSDPDVKFAVTDTNEYTTTEKSLDLLFKAKDFDEMDMLIDGKSVATGKINTSVTPARLDLTDPATPADSIKPFVDMRANSLPLTQYSLQSGETEYQIRLSEIKLPTSGKITFTVILRKGTVTVSQTITIIRDYSPYLVLSPKLPNEAVINANFLPISIKAEGASQVLIGKVEMTKGEGDIFRYEMPNLKAGKNTIKFTVVTGTQKVNGSFDVTYAADNSVAAQYKANVSASGKVNIFSGELQLSFPKNTFLRQANTSPGQDVKTVDLFNSQQIYFGIADRTDGRTLKKYNAVGETDLAGNSLDGTIKDVPVDSYAVDRLTPKTNFAYASKLFWIDAGYFDATASTTSGEFTMVKAMQPYQASNMFYGRVYDASKWLEPSQRGSITLKYDANIANVYGQNLSVWRYTNNGWENIGGVVNTSNKTVTAPFDGFGYYTVMGLRYSFSDIIGHKYARLALESMFSHGVMNNKDANSFGVYENITRGEFAQMLVKMMGIPLQYDPNNMTFDDVQPFDYPDQPYWNYRYVETAVKKGYIRGKSPRLFMPNDNLTRGEAAVMIARALNLVKSNADAEKDLASLQKIFTDASTTDTYAVSSILAVNKAGFISGIANTVSGGKATFRYEPDSNLSRADAAVIAQRVMKKLKKL